MNNEDDAVVLKLSKNGAANLRLILGAYNDSMLPCQRGSYREHFVKALLKMLEAVQ